MTDQPTAANSLMEGRGLGVTAITAILNLNEQPFQFTHLKYPHYNRLIEPGLYRYPRGITAPINWGAEANGLIQFGALGTMWQHNIGDWHVRYKAGGNPVNDGDGDIVYTRRPSGPGEHYLILGVKGNRVTTLKSYTPGEAFLENLKDDVLNVLNVLKPKDYIHLAEHKNAARMFLDRLKMADDAGQLKELDKRDVEALFNKKYGDFDREFQKLTPQEQKDLELAASGAPRGITIAKRVLDGMGILFAGGAGALAVLIGIIALAAIPFGPKGWAFAAVIGMLLTVALGVLGFLSALCFLVAWILSWFEDAASMALVQAPAAGSQ